MSKLFLLRVGEELRNFFQRRSREAQSQSIAKRYDPLSIFIPLLVLSDQPDVCCVFVTATDNHEISNLWEKTVRSEVSSGNYISSGDGPSVVTWADVVKRRS